MPERIRPAAAALSAACLIALFASFVPVLPPTSVRAANDLHSGDVTPNGGATSTSFVFTVVHASAPQGFTPSSVSASVAGLTIPMSPLGGGDPVDGITYQSAGRTLPAGTWTASITAIVQGGTPDPEEVGPITVIAGPTPAPTPTPPPTPTPRPTPLPTVTPPTPTPAPLPPGTPRASPRPTPLPPGVTPLPPTPTPEGSAQTSEPTASAEASASADPSESGSPEQDPSASAGGTASPDASPDEPADATGERGGFGRIGWIVLGGMTSVAGAAVLSRQWLARRRG